MTESLNGAGYLSCKLKVVVRIRLRDSVRVWCQLCTSCTPVSCRKLAVRRTTFVRCSRLTRDDRVVVVKFSMGSDTRLSDWNTRLTWSTDNTCVTGRCVRIINCTRCQQKPQASINCAVCSEGEPKKPSLVSRQIVLNCVPTELVFVNVRYSAYVSSTCMFHARMRTVKMLHSKFVYTSSNLYVSRIRFWLV